MANSASGIGVNDECKLSFLELKARRTHGYVVFKIDADAQQVVVEMTGPHSKTYEDFTRSLPHNDCRYAASTMTSPPMRIATRGRSSSLPGRQRLPM